MGTSAASAVGVAWPWARMRSSTLRREGSAMASHSSSSPDGWSRCWGSGLACDIALQAGQVGVPALGVRLVVSGHVLPGALQRSESAFGHPKPGADALGGEGELHRQRVALVWPLALGVVPAEGEPVRRLRGLHNQRHGHPLAGRPVLEGQGSLAAGSRIEIGGVAEPLADLGGGGDHDLFLDDAGGHGGLLCRYATFGCACLESNATGINAQPLVAYLLTGFP